MSRVRIELIPVIGRSLVGLGISTLLGGTHSLRRLAESFVWGDHDCHSNHSCHSGGCSQVYHHYQHNCKPRCCDCRC